MSPVFVIGSPRSGTTLLRLMLCSHPGLWITPECGFLLWWADKYGDWTEEDPASPRRDAFIADLLSSRKFDTWGLEVTDIAEHLGHSQPGSYAELAAEIYRLHAARAGKPDARWGDKNNYYVNHVPELNVLYPDAVFLHIVRDPRDVVSSCLELKAKTFDSPYAPDLPDTAKAVAMNWTRDVTNAASALQKLGSGRSMLLHYEDLVSQTVLEVGRVCAFLGIDFSESMLQYHVADLEPKATLAWKERTLHPVDDLSVGRFRRELDADQLADVQRVAGELMKQLDYEAVEP